MGVALIRLLADVVTDLGSATCDELVEDPRFKQWTRTQILAGLKNGRRCGLLHCDKRKPRSGSVGAGSEPSRHYPGKKQWVKPEPKPQGAIPPASVWELADMPTRVWPPVGEGRRFNLLGGWTD